MHIGSTAIRVGGQTSVSFLNLDDRTVQIQLNSGTIDVRVRNLYGDDVFEVDTPNLAFTVLRRGDYRITVDPEGSFTTITLRDGQGQINRRRPGVSCGRRLPGSSLRHGLYFL